MQTRKAEQRGVFGQIALCIRRGRMAVFAVFMQQVNLGIIGAGTVGGGVYQALQRNGGLMASRLGVRLQITKIATRDLAKKRPVPIPKGLLTTDWRSVVD